MDFYQAWDPGMNAMVAGNPVTPADLVIEVPHRFRTAARY